MPYPRLHDDGTTVTLDLHGATIDEAVTLARRTVQEAARRGRRTVKLIHGISAGRRRVPDRTIKQALHDLLDRQAFGPWVTGSIRSEGYLTLALDLTAASDPRPLRLQDVSR